MSTSPWRLRERARLPQGDIAFDTFGAGPPAVLRAHLLHGVPFRRIALVDDETLEAYRALWKGEQGQAAYLRKVAHFDDLHTQAFEARLGTIAVPVHVIWGAEDAWLSPDTGRRLCDLIPGAALTIIPDAGHFVSEDAPDEVARALRSFFAGG